MGPSEDELTHVSTVKVEHRLDSNSTMREHLEEQIVDISKVSDPALDLFLYLWKNQPELDHVTATKRFKSQGFFKRFSDSIWLARLKARKLFGSKKRDTILNNIFAPTSTLQLLQRIQKLVPNHSLILADFDSFLMPAGSIEGLNAPMVTNKLKDPTQWKTFNTCLVDRGSADICFPTDFYFL